MTRRSDISHVYIPAVILKLKDLNGHHKILLTLIGRFSNTGKGLKLSNEAIAEMLGISERTASRLIGELQSKRYTVIAKSRSPYRRVYMAENDKTKEILHRQNWSTYSVKNGSTTPNPVVSQRVLSTISINKVNKEDLRREEAFGDSKSLPTGADSFNKFWQAYPRKVGKVAAEKAWKKLTPDEGLVAVIMAALERHKQQPGWAKDNSQYILNPAKWLNGWRWEDELIGETAEASILDGSSQEDIEVMFAQMEREEDGTSFDKDSPNG